MPEVTVVELLKRARVLVEAGWTQNAPARDRRGRIRSPLDSDAVRYCPLGALQRAQWELLGPEEPDRHAPYRAAPYCDAAARLVQLIHARRPRETPARGRSLGSAVVLRGLLALWNDHRGRRRSEVVALIEETIACLK